MLCTPAVDELITTDPSNDRPGPGLVLLSAAASAPPRPPPKTERLEGRPSTFGMQGFRGFCPTPVFSGGLAPQLNLIVFEPRTATLTSKLFFFFLGGNILR